MDRYDGTLVRDVSGLETAMIHLMPKRTEAEVYLPGSLDVTELMRYIEQHPEKHIGLFPAVITALARMITERPHFNRFIQGQKLYQRKKITLSFVCKTRFEDDAPESLVVITVQPDDTISSISARMASEIEKKRAGEVTGSDSAVDRLAKVPFILRVIMFRILRILDYCGADLSKLTETDPNYCSILVSNLGSIGLPAMYHHLNNYGTTSCVMTLGKLRKEETAAEDGTVETRSFLEFGAATDERIADGFYFAKSVRLLQYIISNPELLERPLSERSDFGADHDAVNEHGKKESR